MCQKSVILYADRNLRPAECTQMLHSTELAKDLHWKPRGHETARRLNMNFTTKTIRMASAAALVAATMVFNPANAQEETIKIGVLHSLSGTMAISETTLKDTMLMLIEEQNKKGGVLGKKLEAVVVDPASDWPLFAEKARELLTVSDVDVIFGCWTSVSRKSVLR